MKKYSHRFIHDLLIKKVWKNDGCANVKKQAYRCPYFITLDGVLGSDWGVIINPKSKKFSKLVFEHDWCGCPEVHKEDYQEELDAWENVK